MPRRTSVKCHTFWISCWLHRLHPREPGRGGGPSLPAAFAGLVQELKEEVTSLAQAVSSKRSFLQKILSQPLNCDELPGASETDELCGPEHAKAAPPALSATTTRLAPTSRKSDVVESDFQLNTCQNLVYTV